MKTRGIIFLICLFVCTGMVFAQGGGGFTTDPAADANYPGPYTGQDTPHSFTDTNDKNFDNCDASPIPDWYMKDAVICDWVSEDEDDDGCTNNEEYQNFIAEENNRPKPYAKCLCEDDGICYTNPFLPWCPTYCSNAGEHIVDAIPEFSGTAIIILAIFVIIAALLQGHFHKK